MICWFAPGLLSQTRHAWGSTTSRFFPVASSKRTSVPAICSWARSALPPVTSGITAVTGRAAVAEGDAGTAALRSGSGCVPQAAAAQTTAAARTALSGAVTVGLEMAVGSVMAVPLVR
ncbi:hypothetical protein AB0G19_10900 [Streptomyces althioticus]|uniref:hypothetical protein n=1 Tax=Streptomyces althioticus TaxID=83380 RepID=UPI0033D20AB3